MHVDPTLSWIVCGGSLRMVVDQNKDNFAELCLNCRRLFGF